MRSHRQTYSLLMMLKCSISLNMDGLANKQEHFCRDVPLWQSISKSVALLCAGNQQYRTTWSWSRWSAVVLGRGRWIVMRPRDEDGGGAALSSFCLCCLGVFFTDHTRFLSK